ncbi:MAG TPA: zf-HC2 domain-containing protein [Armatimonadota bacterium]|jgi:anti-sigma factor RsiW|nr:zf-HC2 domain-containing protein [Armatimonadota bacterium]
MSCNYNLEDLSAYVDREVDAEARLAIREHLRDCETCRTAVSELRQVADILHATPAVEPARSMVWGVFEGAPAKPIHCAVVLPEGSAYIDGELDEDEVASLLAHLAKCDACYGAHKQLERVADGLAATQRANVPAGLDERIARAVERERKAVWRPVVSWASQVATPVVRVSVRLAAAALFLMALTLGVFYSFDRSFQGPTEWAKSQFSRPAEVSTPAETGDLTPPMVDGMIAEAPEPSDEPTPSARPSTPTVVASTRPAEVSRPTIPPPTVETTGPVVRPVVDSGGPDAPADLHATPPIDSTPALAPSGPSGVPESVLASVQPGAPADDAPSGPGASTPGGLAKATPTDDGMGPVGPPLEPPPTLVARAGDPRPGDAGVVVFAPRATVTYDAGSSSDRVDSSSLSELARRTNVDLRAEGRRGGSATVTINH